MARPVLVHVGFWARARCVELGVVVASAGLSAVLWGADLPTELLRPDLAPEQMVQLLAALLASAVVLTLRPQRDALAALAAVPLALRRTGWLAVVAVVGCASAVTATSAMPASVAGGFLRNTAAYVGVGLVLVTLSLAAALAVPWVWFSASVTLGLTSAQGQADPAWWALPLQDAGWHTEATAILLLAGAGCWLVRPRS